MTFMKIIPRSLLLVSLALSTGCAQLGLTPGSAQWQDAAAPAVAPPPRPAETASPAAITAPVPRGARTAAAFDRTSEAQKAAALSAPASGQTLGKVTVSLGNPAEQGFWLKSAFVTAKAEGVVKLPDGKSVQVDLLPLAGGGAQMSLAAFRALDLNLTALPEVTVLRR